LKEYKFTAKIEAAERGGAFVLFPYDVEKEFGARGRVPVKAMFDGVAYTGSLIKYGHPLHMLGVSKAICKETGKGPGDTVTVELWKDDEDRTVEVPAQLANAMKREGLLPFFEHLSYTHRKEYCRWISEAKKEETRLKRVQKAVEMLKNGVKTPDGATSRG
jgi:hypothetical protein